MELVVAVAAVVAAVVGVAVGFVARGMWSSQTVKSAQDKAARIVAEARTQQKDMILEAKDEKLRLGREAEDEARAKRTELQNLERRLLARDEQMDQRADMLEEKSRKITDRERDLEKERDELVRLTQEQVVALERVSGLSAEDAKGVLLEAIREEAEHDAVKLARSIERRARDEAQEKAREVIVTAMQRVAADHTAEHAVTVVHLPSDEMKGRIIGREGRNIRALEQATGVDLIIDDTPETVVLSGFDPVRREVARLALTKLIADGRIHPGRIEEIVDKAKAEVDLVIRQAGEQAALRGRRARASTPSSSSSSAGSSTAPATARTCSSTASRRATSPAIMAAELGADVNAREDRRPAARHRQGGRPRGRGPARRYRRRRSRRRYSMPTKIVTSIAAHHEEVESACIEAPIVQVADAISASPARRAPRDAGDVRQAPRGPRRASPTSFAGVERSFADPGRARGPDPRPARGDRRPRRRAASPATSSSKIEES